MSDPFAGQGPAPAPTFGAVPGAAADTSGQSLTSLSGSGTVGQLNAQLFGAPPPPSAAPDKGFDPVGSILGFAGGAVGAVGNVAARILPLGWLPGGADEHFNQMGDWMKQNDPANYAQWEATNAAANADVLNGGNMKVDFTRSWGTKYLDTTKEGGGINPGLMLSPAASLGGGLMDALGILGVGAENVNEFLGQQKLFSEPTGTDAEGKYTYGTDANTRVGALLDKANAGVPLNPVEQEVANNVTSGLWSEQHGLDYLIRNGQGYSSDILEQLPLSLVLDPIMWATLGAGSAIKVGEAGAAIAKSADVAAQTAKAAEGGMSAADLAKVTASAGERFSQAQSSLEKVQVATKIVQDTPILKPVFKVARGIIDPFGAMGSSGSPVEASVDLASGAATRSFEQAVGPGAYSSAFHHADQYGILEDAQAAAGGYVSNTARTWVVMRNAISQLLADTRGERLIDITPDSVVDDLMKNAPKDAVTQLTTFMASISKPFRSAADDQQLIDRFSVSFGKGVDQFTRDVAHMSREEKAWWHATTYEQSWRGFADALSKVDRSAFTGATPLDRLELLNPHNLDNVSAQLFENELQAASTSAEKAALWADAAKRWSNVQDLGRASDNPIVMEQLQNKLRALIDSGRLHTRMIPDEFDRPGLEPLRDWFQGQRIGDRQVWNVGFRPDDFHTWGFVRNADTGLLEYGSTPFVSHVMDAPIAYLPVNMVATNLLGQVIGPVAGVVGKGVEAAEVAMKVARDQISGTRMLNNMQSRFADRMANFGVGASDSAKIFRAARDAAQLQFTTIQGINPINVWDKLRDTLPVELRSQLSHREFMDALMYSAGGDLRIFGLTSGLAQRARTMVSAATNYSDANYLGRLTQTEYRTLRYSLNPVFYVQRITDGIYFSILKGVPPQWFGDIKEGTPLWDAWQIMQRIGETSSARDMAMDMPEYILRSNFQQAMRNRIANSVSGGRLEGLVGAGSRWQRNNQIALFASQLGDIVKSSIEDARTTLLNEIADPSLSEAERALKADALANLKDFTSIKRQFVQNEGRVLTDQEAAVKYFKEIFSDSLDNEKISPDRILQYRESIKVGTYHKPSGFGQLQPLHLDDLAADMGYVNKETGLGDISAMKAAVQNGDRTLSWFEHELRTSYNAHPDYIKRFHDEMNFDWNQFWGDTYANLDLSARDSNFLQGVIAREAQLRGMTPVDYLSQALNFNLGRVGANNHMKQIVALLKAGNTGTKDEQIKNLTDIFIRTLDPSAQRTILAGYISDLPNQIRAASALGTPAGAERATELRGIYDSLTREVYSPTGENAVRNGIAQNYDEFKAMHETNIPGEGVIRDEGVADTPYKFTGLVDPAFDAVANTASRDEAFNTIADIMDQFPNAQLKHIGMRDMGPDTLAGVTDWDTATPTLWISPRLFTKDWAADEAKRLAFKGDPEYISPEFVSSGVASTIWHEFGHVMIDGILSDGSSVDRAAKLADMVRELEGSQFGAATISQYAARGDGRELPGELFALAFDPKVNLSDWPADIEAIVSDLRSELRDMFQKDLGEWRPRETPNVTDIAPNLQDATSRHFADILNERMAGRQLSNADMEAIARHFSLWTNDVLNSAVQATTATSRQWVGELAREVGDRIPTDGAFAYNRTQGLVEQLMKHKVELAQRDAYRLAEMSTTRSVLDRTMNHPLFGLYPTSYMWGKVLPETMRFLAKEPFGLETSAVGLALLKAEQQIAYQREYDPKFRTMWDAVGGSETAFLLDYLTPSLPWSDMRVATPPWAQSIAANKGINPMDMFNKEAATISPTRWYTSPIKSINEWPGAIQSVLAKPVQQPKIPATGAVNTLQAPLQDAMSQLSSSLFPP